MLSIVCRANPIALAVAIAAWGLVSACPIPAAFAQTDETIGSYAGSFDPPTLAHELIIRNAVDHYHLDKVYVFVNTDGKKNYKSSSNERIEMLQEALEDLRDKIVFIPAVSQEKKLKIDELSKTPHSTFYQFVGEDSFQDYKRGVLGANDRIHWVVYRRPDQVPSSLESPQSMPAHFQYQIEPSTNGISSTHARTLIQKGETTLSMLNPRVAKYIEAHELYPIYSEGQLVRLQALHEQGFKQFIRRLHALDSKLDLSSLPTPPFEPAQSREGRASLFVRWVAEQKKITGRARAELEAAAKPLLSKIPHLKAKRAAGGCIRDTMLDALR